MWYRAPDWFTVTLPRKIETGNSDAHGHSPTIGRRSPNAVGMAPPGSSPSFPGPEPLFPPGPQLGDPYWSPLPPMPDPFVDDSKCGKQIKWPGYGCSEDQSMPDYSRATTPSSNHHYANIRHPEIIIHSDLAHATAESQFEEWMASVTNSEDDTSAPAVPGVDSAAETPTFFPKSSASPEPTDFSCPHGQHRAVPVTTRDPPPASRDPSGEMMNPGRSETIEPGEPRVGKVKSKPAAYIRSKKEGQASSQKITLFESADEGAKENGKWSQGKSIVSSDGKRKRSVAYPTSTLLSENTSSSPTRKVSRIKGRGDLPGSDGTERKRDSAGRAPLGALNNIH